MTVAIIEHYFCTRHGGNCQICVAVTIKVSLSEAACRRIWPVDSAHVKILACVEISGTAIPEQYHLRTDKFLRSAFGSTDMPFGGNDVKIAISIDIDQLAEEAKEFRRTKC